MFVCRFSNSIPFMDDLRKTEQQRGRTTRTIPQPGDMSEDLEEYRQILAFLQSSKTQVLAPLDGEGREFWVNAEADPKDGLELDIDGQTRHYTQKEAIVVVQRKIAELQRDV